MGIYHQNNHAKVHLKRDSAHINLQNKDSNAAAARPADPYQEKAAVTSDDSEEDTSGVQTVVSVVYQTVSADFTGSTAGYVTVTPSTAASSPSTVDSATSTKISTSIATVSPTSSGQTISSSTASASSSASEDGSNNKSIFLNAPASAVSAYSATAAAAATGVAAGTPVSATHGNEAIGNTSNGLSGGAKAGVAIGVLLGLAVLAGLLFFCYRRKKNPNAGHNEVFDEKRTSTASSFFGGKAMSEKRVSVASETPSARAASTAPRLSLRPVTQFLPNIGENRKSAGNSLDVAAAMSEKPKSMWERRSNNTQNPFADASVISEKEARPVTPPANPFDEPEGKPEDKSASPEPSTPVKVSTASAVAVAAAGTAGAVSPANKTANNVHRVQLDFKPSMDDELELKSGQLVRVLHEYDDGWALCIRMDRTQQGVAPRTCLSKLPIKPRPQGPPAPGAQNVRPMTPTGPPGMVPRPLTPTQRERSGSNAAPAEATAAVPARKPVPGQAL